MKFNKTILFFIFIFQFCYGIENQNTEKDVNIHLKLISNKTIEYFLPGDKTDSLCYEVYKNSNNYIIWIKSKRLAFYFEFPDFNMKSITSNGPVKKKILYNSKYFTFYKKEIIASLVD